jgi:hypothetical protein
MSSFIRRLGWRSGLFAVAALAATAGIAYATIPNSAGVYTACKLNVTGTIRLIDPSLAASSLLSHCTSVETQISWNQQGQTGTPGKDGGQGPAGATGPQGPPGSVGTPTWVQHASATQDVAAGDFKTVTATCPSGTIATGGGYDSVQGTAVIVTSEAANSIGWQVFAEGGSAGGSFRSVVVCLGLG